MSQNVDNFSETKIDLINSYFKQFDKKILNYQICEICYKTKNLIMCECCKNFFHIQVKIYY